MSKKRKKGTSDMDFGGLCISPKVRKEMEKDYLFEIFCFTSILLHERGDWGILPKKLQKENRTALKQGGLTYSMRSFDSRHQPLVIVMAGVKTILLFTDELDNAEYIVKHC